MLSNYRVLVTPTSYARYDERLRTELESQVGEVVYNETGTPLTADALIEIIADVDGYIAGLDEITRDVIRAADRLRVIARYGVGVDNVDLEAAAARSIVVTNTPGANSVSVAELTIALMLALARNVVTAAQATKAGEWPRMRGLALEGKTVGIYGLGSIGKEVARRLAGFDCTILAYDVQPDHAFADAQGVQFCSQSELLRRSDVLTLHCPLVADTEHLVDETFLCRMKPGAFLINTARGELLDDDAVVAALEREHVRSVALDAFSQQPPGPDHPLLRHPRVIATPHMGAHTDGAANAMGWGALRNCLTVLRGEEPEHRVV